MCTQVEQRGTGALTSGRPNVGKIELLEYTWSYLYAYVCDVPAAAAAMLTPFTPLMPSTPQELLSPLGAQVLGTPGLPDASGAADVRRRVRNASTDPVPPTPEPLPGASGPATRTG